MSPLFGGFLGLGGQEMLILLILGVLLFGRKLPEVGRYLGKGIVEFKKGIKGLEDSYDDHFFFQAEDGIRVADVTGVQTCALPI